MTEPIVIVGAGVAGLICARVLTRAGRAVVVLEREPDVGGRVRTVVRDGFTLDRGFQVAFEAYPTLRQHIDYGALDMRWFQSAGRICRGDGRAPLVGDALADWTLLAPTLLEGGLPWGDLLRMWALRREATGRSFDECFVPAALGRSTRDYLAARGFGPGAIEGFFAPFYGGILLDRSLETSASVLLYTFKMLAEGRTGIPRLGMGAMTAQLAASLPAGTVRTGVTVRGVRVADGRATGVVLADGSEVSAAGVVLATDAPALAALVASAGASVAIPTTGKGVTTCYFASRTPALPGRALWLNAARDAVVSHAVTVTEVAREQAPPGQHLLATNTVGAEADWDDARLEAGVRADLARMRGAPMPDDLRLVAMMRVPFAQVAQPPRSVQAMAPVASGVPGLVLASELGHSSSLEGAARGGEAAARVMLSAAPRQ